MPHEALYTDLALWRELGWMRVLEEQFARFLGRIDATADERVLFAAALASHQLGRGHVCLPLAECLAEPLVVLGLPPEMPEPQAAPDPDRERREADARQRLERRLEALELEPLQQALNASVLVSGEKGSTPLVHDRGSLYLRRTWQAETDIAEAIASRREPLPSQLGPEDVGRLIREIFGLGGNLLPAGGAGVDWQQVACAVAARSPLSIVTGGPGTGKTWTAVRIIALLQKLHPEQAEMPLRIRLAAPTGKAAQRLTESVAAGWHELKAQIGQLGLVAPEPASTLHRLLGSQRHTRHFRHDRTNPVPADVVIVDEASMIDQELMQSLLDALAPSTRLVLLGDKNQLASVEAGAVFGDLCQGADGPGRSPTMVDWLERVTGVRPQTGVDGALADQRVVLQHNHRAEREIQALAECVNTGDAEGAAGLLDRRQGNELQRPRIDAEDDTALRKLLLHGDAGGAGREGYLGYLEVIHAQCPNAARPAQREIDDWARDCLDAYSRFQVLTAVRQGPWGVAGINRRVREWLGQQKIRGEAAISGDDWFHGRPVMITRNDYATGLMNGDIGLCLAVPVDGEPRLRVVFRKAENELQYFSPGRIRECQTAWAMTVHKSQGSEFDHAVLVLPEGYGRVVTRELIYTGLTRARRRFTLAAPDLETFKRGVRHRTRRHSGLAVAIQRAAGPAPARIESNTQEETP